ncbi:MAG: hypothetical protein OSB41_02925, partial [Kiritimatiellae bacterium]|nr:hypothetical protein [Kiritimatiellia bacterium]
MKNWIEKTNTASKRALSLRGILILAGAVSFLIPSQEAVSFDDVPDYLFYVHMAVPKDGLHPRENGGLGANAEVGAVRNIFETTIETYWKETSYHEPNPVTGVSDYGFYADSRTLGYVFLPWPTQPPGVRADQYATVGGGLVVGPVSFAGEPNYETGDPLNIADNGQLFGGTGPLIDGVWTPGERFQDTNGDGEWTAGFTNIVEGDNWYDTDNVFATPTNWPGEQQLLGYNGAADGGPDAPGELFADYDGGMAALQTGTNAFSGVDFDANLVIAIADPTGESNRFVTVSEFDLTPDAIPTREGDFYHTCVLDPSDPGPAVDIPRNSEFDYMRDPNGTPYVSQRDDLFGDPMTVSYQQYVATNGAVYAGTTPGVDGAVLVTIEVPVYQSSELWGTAFATGVDTVAFQDDDGIFEQGVIEFIDEEPFEDFISWWVPFVGADGQGRWLGGLIGAGIPDEHQPNRSPIFDNVITYADYVAYIEDNYPGFVAAMIARAGNGVYDGPDNWNETIDNKMQILGLVNNGILLSAEPSTYPPLFANWWDPHNWAGQDWMEWWRQAFGSEPPTTYGSPFNVGAWWPGDAIPNAVEFTTIAPGVDAWYPSLNSGWGYDGPREFQDLPSSLYHLGGDPAASPRGQYAADPYPSGGDLRLGEVTDPLGTNIYGFDAGISSPDVRASYGAGDGYIPAGGPYSYNGHAQFTFDAGNVLSLEVATWRTDGEALTGPVNPGVSVGSGISPIPYGGDHRDRNLDGLIDHGETVPSGSHAYYVDDDPITPDSGGTSDGVLYPFNWDRYVEDVVEVWDYAEDYEFAQTRTLGAVDELIHAPRHVLDVPLTGVAVSNVAGVANIFPHSSYIAGDAVWEDVNANGIFDIDVAVAPPGAFISQGTIGIALNDVAVHDSDSNGVVNLSFDNIWIDEDSNSVYDAEIMLSDIDLAAPGLVGQSLNIFDPNVRVVYRELVGDTNAFNYGDAAWVENLTGGATNGAVDFVFDATDVLLLNWTGLTFGDAADGGAITNAIYAARRLPGEPNIGFRQGDTVWIDANNDLEFTSEQWVSLASGLNSVFADPTLFLAGSVSTGLTSAAAYLESGDDAGFQIDADTVWHDPNANAIFDQETILTPGLDIAAGALADFVIPNAYYADLNTNGVLDVMTETEGVVQVGDGGDAIWVDVDGDELYGATAKQRTPVYFVPIHNAPSEPRPPAGNTFSVYHRDSETPMTGLMHLVNPDMVPGLLQHEFGHDALGWPDLYDYDVDLPFGENTPIGGFDLMAGGGMVHGIPDMKVSSDWITPVDLASVVGSGSGIRTIQLWPIERHRDNYFVYFNDADDGHDSEYFWIWYQSGVQANQFANFAGVGAQGVHISHTDFGSFNAAVPQQRINNHYRYHIVQADGLYEMEDGLNGGNNDDVFPGTSGNNLFSADTIPWSRWWSGLDSGMRIIDIRLPATPLGPAEIDVELFNTSTPWVWPAVGADVDADGIVDIWEFHYFGGLDVVNELTDWDNDGLSDLGEYLSATDPTSLGGSTDYDDDADNDGLANGDEVEIYGSDPQLADTDDDGIIDSVEVAALSDPIDPLSPLVDRVLELDGTPGSYLELPDSDRFALETWYISAWVKPMATTGEVAI